MREALKKDFHKLYVKAFTTTWKAERFVRDVEIDVMSLDNLLALIDPKLEGRKAFLALPIEERRRLLAEQVMLMEKQDREAREDLHKLD